MDIQTKVSEFLSKKFLNDGQEQLGADAPLLESGILDSAGIFELVTFLEDQFNISVSDEEIVVENFENIGSISRRKKK